MFDAAGELRAPSRRFRDRSEGGQALASRLAGLRSEAPVVLGIPGGGVPVAAEIARALGADLDVLCVQPVRSLRSTEPELGLLPEHGPVALDPDRVVASGLSEDEIAQAVLRARQALQARALVYRAGRPLPDLTGRTVILVDDGILSGRTMRAALSTRAHFRPRRIIVATPVAAAMVARLLRSEADDVVGIMLRAELRKVADGYEDFHPLADVEILGEISRGRVAVLSQADLVVSEVDVETRSGSLAGTLTRARGARGLVVLPCAGATDRPRARALARTFADEDFSSLVVDLGDSTTQRGARLTAAVDWLVGSSLSDGLGIGLLGGAEDVAALLEAAAARPGLVRAVVVDGAPAALATLPPAPAVPTLLLFDETAGELPGRRGAIGLRLRVAPADDGIGQAAAFFRENLSRALTSVIL